jgi:serine/threonine protein kinase
VRLLVLAGPPIPEPLGRQDRAEVAELGISLIELLGEAGRSRTWLAVDASGQPRVARRLPPRPDDERTLLANSLVRLVGFRAPGLLRITQLWAETETWVVREYQDGVSLRRLLRSARLTAGQIAAIMGDVLVSLSALHAAGLVHGALHPGNVIIGFDGEARLCDAGQQANRQPQPTMQEDGADAAQLAGSMLATTNHARVGKSRGSVSATAILPRVEAMVSANGRRPLNSRPANGRADALRRQLRDLIGEVRPITRRELAEFVTRLVPRPAIAYPKR